MKGRQFRLIKLLVVALCVCVCVGEIISLIWFYKELKTTYQKTTGFVMSSLYFSFANQYSLGGGFPFPIVLVPRYKLSLCHTPIKPDLLGFSKIGVFACGLRDHVITRFTSSCNWPTWYLQWVYGIIKLGIGLICIIHGLMIVSFKHVIL
jgi:hypothetical protein